MEIAVGAELFWAEIYRDRRPDGSEFRRLAVCRHSGDRLAAISWEQLAEVKRRMGLGDVWCAEVYPPDGEIVNVAPIRHLVLIERPPYAWDGQAKMDVDSCVRTMAQMSALARAVGETTGRTVELRSATEGLIELLDGDE